MSQSLFRENVEFEKQRQRDFGYTERTWALTGRLNGDGTVDNDTTADLDDGLMWVRVRGGRGQTAAVIAPGMYDHYSDYDRKIRVGYNDEGELVAIEPYASRTTTQTQGSTALKESNRPLPLKHLMGLRVLPPRDSHASGLWVFLEAYLPLGWRGGDVDVSAGEPDGTGEFGFTSVSLQTDGTPYVHVHAAEVKPSMWQLPFDAAALIAQLPSDVYPCGAVTLFNGQTAVTRANTRYEDLRLVLNSTPPDPQDTIDLIANALADGANITRLTLAGVGGSRRMNDVARALLKRPYTG